MLNYFTNLKSNYFKCMLVQFPAETICHTDPLQSTAIKQVVTPNLEEEESVGPIKVCSVRLRRLSNEEISDNQKPTSDLKQPCLSSTNDITESPLKVDKFNAVIHFSSPRAKQNKSETSGRNSTPIKQTVRGARWCGANAVGTPTRQLKIVDMLSNKSPNMKLLADTGEQCKNETVCKSLCLSEATNHPPVNMEVLVEDSQLPMSCAIITSEEPDGPDIMPMCIEETPPSDSLDSIESGEQDASSRQSSVSKRLFPAKVKQSSCLSDNIKVAIECEPVESSASLNHNPAVEKLFNEGIMEADASQTVIDAVSQNNELMKVDDNGSSPGCNIDTVAGSTSRQEISMVQSDIVIETFSPSEFMPTAIKQLPRKRGRRKKGSGVSDALSKQVTSCVECDIEADTMPSTDIQTLAVVPESSLDTILPVDDNKTTSNMATRKRAKQRRSVENTCTTSGADNSVSLNTSEVINEAEILMPKPDSRVDGLKSSSKLSTRQKASRCQSGSEKHDLTKNVTQETFKSSEDVESVEPSILETKSVARQMEVIDINLLGAANVESETDENTPLISLNKSENVCLPTRRKSCSRDSLNSSKLSVSNNLISVSSIVETDSGTATGKNLRSFASQNDPVTDPRISSGSVSSKKMDVSMEIDSEDDLPLSSLSGCSQKDITLSQSIKPGDSCKVIESGGNITSTDHKAVDQSDTQSSYPSPKSDDDDLPLKCFSRACPSVCEVDQQQVCQPYEVLQCGSRKRKCLIPVRSPDRHLHSVTKASMKTNIYLRQNKLNLRSKTLKQKAGEVLLSGKSAMEHIYHHSKINTRSRKKPENTVVAPRVKTRHLMQFPDDAQKSVVQQDPICTTRGNTDSGSLVANSVTIDCKDEAKATLLTVESRTERVSEDVITIDDSQVTEGCYNSELNEVDECVSLIVDDNRLVTVEQQDECESLNTDDSQPYTVEQQSEFVSEDIDSNQQRTVEQPTEGVSLVMCSNQSCTVEPLAECVSLDTEGIESLTVELPKHDRVYKDADINLSVTVEPVVVPVVHNAESQSDAVSVNANVYKSVTQLDVGFDELSTQLATNADELDVDSDLQNKNCTSTYGDMQIDDCMNESIAAVHDASSQFQKNGMSEVGQVVGSGDFVIPVVVSTGLNSQCLELTNVSTQVGDSATADTALNLSPDFLQKTAVKFAMPVDRLPVCSSEAPPETPTSASRKTFTSRGSLMVQRAKQMQKTGSVVSSKPMEDESPSTVERSKSSFLQRVYSPSASPSASILRKRHLIIAESTIESPSPPNKVSIVCPLFLTAVNCSDIRLSDREDYLMLSCQLCAKWLRLYLD